MRINVNDFDDELWEKAVTLARINGCKATDNEKKKILHYMLSNYVDLAESQLIDNPLIVKKIKNVTEAALDETERRLGGRLIKLISDNTINLSVLTQIFHDTMNQFDDPVEAELRLSQYRARAVEQLRENKAPLTYIQLVKEPLDE